MVSWTKPDDVTNAWIGEGAPTDTAKIQTWIDRAEREARFRVPNLDKRMVEDHDFRELAIDVFVAMVTRVFRNPEGFRSINDVTGPFTATRTYGGDVPGGLALTDDEMSKLSGAKEGAFSIDLIPSTSPFYMGPRV